MSLLGKSSLHRTEWRRIDVRKAFAVLVTVYILAASALLRADFAYIDDVGRAFAGYDGWGSSFSRHLSDVLSHLVHASSWLSDVSPLTQLIAIVLLVCASLVLVRALDGSNDGISPWTLVAVIPLGLSPYFLECLSYKYDAPYMALSVLASVAPLLLWQARKAWIVAATFGCTRVMLTTYQASSGILPMCAIFVALLSWRRGETGKSIAYKALYYGAAYALAMAVFYYLIMGQIGAGGEEYVSSGLATPANIKEHYISYFQCVLNDFKAGWTVIAAIIAIIFFPLYAAGGGRAVVSKALLSVAGVAISSLFSFGLYPLLEQPLYAPRAMYGFGVLIALITTSCVIVAGSGGKAWAPRILAVVLAWSFITFTCTYGNALSMQAEWETFRRDDVAEAVASQAEFGNTEQITVYLVGNVGYAPSVRGMSAGCNILQRLIPITLRGDWSWGISKLQNYYGLDNVTFVLDTGTRDFDDFELVEDTIYHQLWRNGNELIVRLSQEEG